MNENKVNICFVANFYKTFLFHEIAKKLLKENIGIYWIVTKSEQFSFLEKEYGKDHVLYINRSFCRKRADVVDDFRVNELVYGDRVFKHHPEMGIAFLNNVQQPLYQFLKQNTIHFVFGEITWAHELLIQRMVQKRKELSCMYLEGSLVRIPNKRFAFFTDDSQYEMLEFDEPSDVSEIIKLEKPSYLKLNDKIMKKNSSVMAKLSRIKRFISDENIEKNDPNVITDKAIRFRINSNEEYNKIAYKRIQTVSFTEIENENYIFVGFHKQPEASIDVSGRYYEDQAQNIINLWRLLPHGWKIVVKEHTNAIGDRSYAFYKRLLSYPGVLMVHETTDSAKLIAKSKLVATVTGTIAYEAALMKVPAITFAKVFFNRINYCRYVTIDDLVKHGSLSLLAEELKAQPDNRLEFSRYLLKNTFSGYISDFVTDPSVMEDENIEVLKNAFMKLINRYGK